jgi:hypothetical protein
MSDAIALAIGSDCVEILIGVLKKSKRSGDDAVKKLGDFAAPGEWPRSCR